MNVIYFTKSGRFLYLLNAFYLMPNHPKHNSLEQPVDIFSGRSEMHARIRAYDWAASPLGPVASWPQSLRSLVRTLLASRYPMVLTWGPNFLQFYNDAYSKLIGDKHPDALGLDIRITLAEGWDTLGPMITEVMRSGVANWTPALLLVLERSGYREEAYFSVSHAPAEDDDGQIVGMLAVCSEVTQQVLGERRLRLLRDLGYKAGEARHVETICHELPAIIAEHPLDVPFALIYLQGSDDRALTLCGSTGLDDQIIAQLGLRELHAGDGTLWQIERAIAGETVVVDRLEQHFTLLGGVLNEPVRSALVTPIVLSAGSAPRGILVTGVNPNRALDESYRSFYQLLAGQVSVALRNAQAYEEERQRAESLAELDRVKTEFFSNVSHEFRTPLTLMLGPIEQLLVDARERGETDAEQLAIAHRNGLRLLKLVNNLLDFSRVEAGRLTTALQPTDLATYTADLASSFRSIVERAGLALHVDCPELAGPVLVDQAMWETIVLNLLSNAYKFTLEGEIAVTLRANEEQIELSVRDTGVGIPESDLPHMFERFHRVRGVHGRTHEGAGIGLALVHELVRLHGGHVAVESQVNHGTTFQVVISHVPVHSSSTEQLLPTITSTRAYVEEAARWIDGGSENHYQQPNDIGHGHEDGAPAAPSSPYHSGKRPHVLLAEDNADMRAYVQRILGDTYTITAVGDGRSALQQAQRALPDMIISDVMMPELDGFALLRALRAEPRTAAIPIILLSARAGQEATVDGFNAGADDYLVKPFSANELRARVRTHLQLAEMRRQLAEEQALRRSAEAAVHERDTFLTLAAHELRTPLTSLQGYAQLLERRSQHAGEVGRNLQGTQVIVKQARRLNTLVNMLLDVSRIQAGQFSLNQEPLELNALVQQVVGELRLAVDTHTLTFGASPSAVWVVGDALRLEQVLHNLILNGAKYSPNGSEITVCVEEREGQACIHVRDQGIGIPAQEIPRLFERFYRAKNINQAQVNGLGIGLFVVQEIVTHHKGTISVESVEGEGSTFTVFLPLSNRAHDAAQ